MQNLPRIDIQIIRTDTHDLSYIASEMQQEKWETSEGSYSIEKIEKFVSNPNNYLLVAFIDNKVVGALNAYKLDRMDNRWSDMYIDEVETKKEFRRQGIAKAMIKKIYEIGRKEGCGELWVGAESDNSDANELYKNMGFKTEIIKADIYTYKISK